MVHVAADCVVVAVVVVVSVIVIAVVIIAILIINVFLKQIKVSFNCTIKNV